MSRPRRFAAAVLSGLLLAAAFPPLDLGPLALVALVPLLWAWRGVPLLPDGGRGYLNKIFSDKWMADYGFLDVAAGETVGDVLRAKSGETPTLVHTHPNETVRDAIDILREYGVSQLPVVRGGAERGQERPGHRQCGDACQSTAWGCPPVC